MEEEEKRRLSIRRILVILVILVLIVVSIMLALLSLPLRPETLSAYEEVPHQEGADKVNIEFVADVAEVIIAFEELDGKHMTVNVSLTGHTRLLSPHPKINLTLYHGIPNGALNVNSRLRVDTAGGSVHVVCEIRIDPSLNVTLDVQTNNGDIRMDTQAGVVLEEVTLSALKGNVEVSLVEDSALLHLGVFWAGQAFDLTWENVVVEDGLYVHVEAYYGDVKASVVQNELPGEIDFGVASLEGEVDFTLDIRGGVAATIDSHTPEGEVHIERKDGFQGTEAHLESLNYPSETYFDVSLGGRLGVNISAGYVP